MVNGNAFKKQEERKNKLKELSEKYQFEALLKLASKLGISAEDLLRIFAGVQGIDPILGRKIEYQWIIEFGTTKVEVPKPELIPEETTSEPIPLEPLIEVPLLPFPAPRSILDEPIECSIHDIVFKFVGKNNKSYKTSNIKDVLPRKIDDFHYDKALPIVMPEINDILHQFFKGNFEIEEDQGLSSGITTKCPEYRKFEMEILDDQGMQYFLIYGKGTLIESDSSLPYEKIVTALRNKGYWEK